MDLLKKYTFLVDEYRLLTEKNLIPKRKNNVKHFEYKELVLKITLLRKFMMKDEEMYIINILNKIKKINGMADDKEIDDLEKRIYDLFRIEFSYSLSNSNIQHLYHSVTDLIYGLYLHSDTEKIENAILSDESIRKVILINFIQKFDPILYSTYELIKAKSDLDFTTNEENRLVPIIHFANKINVKRNVELSPRWTNIDGHDIKENEIERFIYELDNRDTRILKTASKFISLLQENTIDVNHISRLLTPQSPISSNIKENSEIIKSIKNIALSNKVRYSTNLKYAFVYFFEDVISPFSINSPQILRNVHCIRFKKQLISNNYKINNFVNELPSYYMMTIQNQLK